LKKSRQEGRKVPEADAVEDPSAIYMVTAAQKLGFDVGLEPSKRHPRDPFNFGRLRIKFKQNGKLVNPSIDTKTKLYTLIAKGMADAIKDTPDEDGNVAKYAAHARSVLNIPPLTNEEEPSSSTDTAQIEPAKAPEPATASALKNGESISKKKKKDKRKVFRG
jgi:signal recognition particle subunit SEC65